MMLGRPATSTFGLATGLQPQQRRSANPATLGFGAGMPVTAAPADALAAPRMAAMLAVEAGPVSLAPVAPAFPQGDDAEEQRKAGQPQTQPFVDFRPGDAIRGALGIPNGIGGGGGTALGDFRPGDTIRSALGIPDGLGPAFRSALATALGTPTPQPQTLEVDPDLGRGDGWI